MMRSSDSSDGVLTRRKRSAESMESRLRPRAAEDTQERAQKAARARLLESPLPPSPLRRRPPKTRLRKPLLSLSKRRASSPGGASAGLSPSPVPLFDSLSACYSDVGVELPDLRETPEEGKGLIDIQERPELQSITIKIPKRFFTLAAEDDRAATPEALPPSGAFSFPGAWRSSSSSLEVGGSEPRRKRAEGARRREHVPKALKVIDANLQASGSEDEAHDHPAGVAPAKPCLVDAESCTSPGPLSSDRSNSPIPIPSSEIGTSPRPRVLSLSGLVSTTDIPPPLRGSAHCQTVASAVRYPPKDAATAAAHPSLLRRTALTQAAPDQSDAEGQTAPTPTADGESQTLAEEPREPSPPIKDLSPGPLKLKTEEPFIPAQIPLVPSPPGISEAVRGLLMLAGKVGEPRQESAGGLDALLAPLPPHFAALISFDTHPNGGATLLRCDWAEVRGKLCGEAELARFAETFIELGLREDAEGAPIFTMAVIRGGACDVPEPLEWLAQASPGLPVKIGSLTNKQKIETTTIGKYQSRVAESYAFGTFRAGPLNALSVVGTAQEETGDYFPAYLAALEASPFLRPLLPWGVLAVTAGTRPQDSDDGPIIWTRPGEQLIPTTGTPRKATGGSRELGGLYSTLRTSEKRQHMFEDRTPCHADHVGDGLERRTTAAVGVIKAIRGPDESASAPRRIVKDVVAFRAGDFSRLVEVLQLDLYEPPMTQCVQWVEEARLNALSRDGIGWTRMTLADDDLYFLPRNIVHQFRTVAAASSVAWHVQLRQYHP